MDLTFYNLNRAAEYLARLMPDESPSYWRSVLLDHRQRQRPARLSIACVETADGVLYEVEALQRFADRMLLPWGAEDEVAPAVAAEAGEAASVILR